MPPPEVVLGEVAPGALSAGAGPARAVSKRACHAAGTARRTASAPASSAVAGACALRSSSMATRSLSSRPNHPITGCRSPCQALVPAVCTTAVPPTAASAVNPSAGIRRRLARLLGRRERPSPPNWPSTEPSSKLGDQPPATGRPLVGFLQLDTLAELVGPAAAGEGDPGFADRDVEPAEALDGGRGQGGDGLLGVDVGGDEGGLAAVVAYLAGRRLRPLPCSGRRRGQRGRRGPHARRRRTGQLSSDCVP